VVHEVANCKLRVLRPAGGYADRLRAYKIYVDDNLVGTISRNSVLEVEIPSGDHVMRATIDYGRSESLKITAALSEIIEIEVSNHWGTILSLWAITFGFGSYLSLRRL
jgi:hypothetical protein